MHVVLVYEYEIKASFGRKVRGLKLANLPLIIKKMLRFHLTPVSLYYKPLAAESPPFTADNTKRLFAAFGCQLLPAENQKITTSFRRLPLFEE